VSAPVSRSISFTIASSTRLNRTKGHGL
jgi:hypothetical protein